MDPLDQTFSNFKEEEGEKVHTHTHTSQCVYIFFYVNVEIFHLLPFAGY